MTETTNVVELLELSRDIVQKQACIIADLKRELENKDKLIRAYSNHVDFLKEVLKNRPCG